MNQDLLYKKRHSLAHILMMAVLKFYPNAKAVIGPVIENGFYYDIDFNDKKLEEKDLEKIEKEMQNIISQNLNFVKEEISEKDAKEMFKDNKYKLELIDIAIKKEENTNLTIYKIVEENTNNVLWFDLCKGEHISNTKEINKESFKIDKIAGSYFLGDEKRERLTRIYGIAFNTKEELIEYQNMMEEAKKRDHKILGKELKLFVFSDLVGPGLPLWTPRGTILRNQIDDFIWSIRSKYNYQKVTIPLLTKKDLYIKSGHYEKYAEDLFRVETRDKHELFIKPMNCPHHAQIFNSELRSYKELPIRYCETTQVYRDEQSGELNGLSRVLSITQDDSHIFCTEDQIENEIKIIWDMIEEFYKTFDFKIVPRFSSRDEDKKFKGNDEFWTKSEGAILKIIKERVGDNYIDGKGEAAFYGPKIDFITKDSIGREWQVGTAQLDFYQPESFELEYINSEGIRKRPVMIHCAIAGSLERFISVYIEHVAGIFPFWIAPTQVSIIPIDLEKHENFAKEIFEKLKENNIRVELLNNKNGLGKNVKYNKEMKYPYWIVIGDKEIENKTLSVEGLKGEKFTLTLDELLERFKKEIKERK